MARSVYEIQRLRITRRTATGRVRLLAWLTQCGSCISPCGFANSEAQLTATCNPLL
jgi:hypothetical protein